MPKASVADVKLNVVGALQGKEIARGFCRAVGSSSHETSE
jgi:hypothetical protein